MIMVFMSGDLRRSKRQGIAALALGSLLAAGGGAMFAVAPVLGLLEGAVGLALIAWGSERTVRAVTARQAGTRDAARRR